MPGLDNNAKLKLIKTFGRLKGRPLSQNQKLGMVLLKEKYNFFLETEKKVWVEVGFGNGYHLIELAKRNYDKVIVGSEVYENGVATTCFSLFKNPLLLLHSQNTFCLKLEVCNFLEIYNLEFY